MRGYAGSEGIAIDLRQLCKGSSDMIYFENVAVLMAIIGCLGYILLSRPVNPPPGGSAWLRPVLAQLFLYCAGAGFIGMALGRFAVR